LAKTTLATVTNPAWYAVTASDYTPEIEVGEDPAVTGWPTTDLQLAKPTTADGPRTLSGGVNYIFRANNGRLFGPGEVVGFIRPKTASASVTLFIDEKAY